MIKLPSSLTTVTPFSKLLAGILFITLIVSAFFAGMKYQRAITLIAYQQSNLTTPTPSPIPVDETANWKTYTNINGNFTIQYPVDWKLTETHTISSAVPNEINAVTFEGTEGEFSLGWNEPYGGGGCDGTKVVNLKQISIKGCDGIENGNEYWNLFTYKPNNSKYSVHMSAIATPSSNANLIRKIFSTLKFTDSSDKTTSPTPTCRPRPACLDATPRCMIPETSDMCPRATACTMEAKLCPDGKTYVSRTGPKCEFTACP